MLQEEDAADMDMAGVTSIVLCRLKISFFVLRAPISHVSSPAVSPTISHQLQRFLASSEQAKPIPYPVDRQTSFQSLPTGYTNSRNKDVPHFPAPSAPIHIVPKNDRQEVKRSSPQHVSSRTPRRRSPEPTVPSHVVPKTPVKRSQSSSPHKAQPRKVKTPSKVGRRPLDIRSNSISQRREAGFH